jgi:hypothetical protein
MHIAGAKKHRLVGDPPEPAETAEGRDAAEMSPRPADQVPLRQPGRRGGMHYLSSTNVFGLTSRSEQYYPELFRPVSRLYWLRSSPEEQAELIRRQAEIVEKISYRESGEPHIPTTQADMAYESARVRRVMALRRRRKRRGYEGRKQEEEERRKAPLVRRYLARDARFGITPIMTVSALANPVVISGLLRRAPASRRGGKDLLRARVRGQTRQPPRLPVTDTSGSPQVRIRMFNNAFGLKPRPVTSYPEVYAKVSQVYWRSMPAEQRRSVFAVQATAMEKVGFEQGTTKYFTEDFDPMQQNIYSTGTEEPEESQPSRPTSVLACVALILAGAVSSIAVLLGDAEPGWLLISAALIAVGISLGIPVQRPAGG